MVLKDILSISGESGLFRFVAQGKNAIIVEHLETKKRSTAFASAKVSSLDEISVFTEEEDKHANIHEISNLALLGQAENSALNNSVFEVKRREIIDMDRQGKYIPICTRRVFLKYYNKKPSAEHYYYWGREDRTNYYNEIVRVLKENNYLSHESDLEV